jgi:biopolymer transport protein ExbB/TolQ
VNNLQQLIYDVARILLWPVLIAAIICLVWVLIELGVLLYELWLRFRYRDLDALEVRALRARKAFRDGKPRTAYRYLQENNYSLVVVRFLYDLIRNYQTERLAAKPLKLLQEYEFYTIKRLERTRILVRIGPMLGLMGTLIPLSPALVGLASGDMTALSDNLVTAFSVTVIGLLIGGLAFLVSIVRDRLYSQDISDMEYLLELLEGSDVRLRSGRRLSKTGVWDSEEPIEYEVAEEDAERTIIATLPETPDEPLLPVAALPAGGNGGGAKAPKRSTDSPAEKTAVDRIDEDAGLTFDDPSMDWSREDDPFADLGPVDPEGTDDPKPRGAGGPLRRR